MVEPLDTGYTACEITDRSTESGSGEQHIYKFPNSYGASVIRNSGNNGYVRSYGYPNCFELAPVRFTDDGTDWGRVHFPDITGDADSVIGWLNVPEVAEILRKIAALPKPPGNYPRVQRNY